MSLVVLPNTVKEQEAVEKGLLCHMLWMSADLLRAQGWQLRQDVFIQLSRGAAAAVADLNEGAIARCAQRIDTIATAVLRDLSFDDPRDGLISTAMLVLKLVDEGLFEDRTNQAILVSLLIIDDAKDAGSDIPFNENVLTKNIGKMLLSLTLQGLYIKLGQA